MNRIFIGTSGYTYKDWKARFYPEHLPQKEWLRYYSREFTTVEINATFYGSFTETQIKRWHDETPDEFLFSIKGSRFITHVRRLQITKEDIMLFFDQLAPLGRKLTCVLWQMPGNFRFSEENLEKLAHFLSLLPKNIRQSIEFRDSSWFRDSLWRLLQENAVGFVIGETSEFPVFEKITADFVYIRFHGPAKLYASKYTDENVRDWTEKIQQFAENHDVYCYFNNDFSGYAIENAKRLKQLLKESNIQSSTVAVSPR